MTHRKILVVDDEQDILDYIERELIDQYKVAKAHGGADAIVRLQEDRFDVILTDVRMPGIDGIQLLHTIKRLSPNCEVVLMSGYADIDIVINALNEGAFAFVTKPLIKDVLQQRIGNAIAVVQSRENEEKVMQDLKRDLLDQTVFAQKLSALAATSGSIAHELQQPLTGIIVLAAGLKRSAELNKTVETGHLIGTLTKIEDQVQRAARVIDHIKRFTSDTSGQEQEELPLKDMIESGLELFQAQMKSRGIKLSIDVPESLKIRANRIGFEEVVINLVSNARDSMIEATENTDATRQEISFRGYLENTSIVLEVSDTGSGIVQGVEEKLFEPFATTKRSTGGSGLGLFICRKVLHDFDAHIELKSTGMKGTTFQLRFPAL